MGRAADPSAIQIHTLNTIRGLSVCKPRAQVDIRLYKQAIDGSLVAHHGLDMVQDSVENYVFDGKSVAGVATSSGDLIRVCSVVLTAETFFNGTLHVSSERTQGELVGDNASVELQPLHELTV